MKEIWKSIKNFSGYEVSNLGRVRSVDRIIKTSNGKNNHYKSKVLHQHKNSMGYYRVHLKKNGKDSKQFVHRLVAKAFIPNPNNKPQVNHINNNHNINSVDNLEWATQEENMQHYWNNYEKKGHRKALVKNGKIQIQKILGQTAKPVKQIDRITNEVIAVYPSAIEAERILGIDNAGINRVCHGKRNHAGGYKWVQES